MHAQDERQARQTRRDFCRGCSQPTLAAFAGWVTDTGIENSIRPRAYYRICGECGLLKMVLSATVPDAEGVARAVLDDHLRTVGGRSTAIATPYGPPPWDWDAGLYFLLDTLWRLYSDKWNPAFGVTFLAYGTGTLRQRLSSWIRDESGDASERSKGRVHPKAHAPSVSVSLDQIYEHDGRGEVDDAGGITALGIATDNRGALAGAVIGRAGDAADDRSPDLAWALAARSRET